tara:strand:- start:276 stop:833 length:558 start_codon:yes stop_codon:yes gene_type:complete
MFKKYFISLVLPFFVFCLLLSSNLHSESLKSIYDFQFESIDGSNIKMENFAGKLVLVVNTASNCGFTKQYAGLQEVWDTYKSRGFIVLGIPSNSFNQELKDNKSIADFCEVNFGINFPMTVRTPVVGENSHPFYVWLKEYHGIVPAWNFSKVLISGKGEIIDSFSSRTKPNGKEMLLLIEENLDG